MLSETGCKHVTNVTFFKASLRPKDLLLPQKNFSIFTLGEEKIGFKVGKERGYPEDFQTPPIIFIPGAILIEL